MRHTTDPTRLNTPPPGDGGVPDPYAPPEPPEPATARRRVTVRGVDRLRQRQSEPGGSEPPRAPQTTAPSSRPRPDPPATSSPSAASVARGQGPKLAAALRARGVSSARWFGDQLDVEEGDAPLARRVLDEVIAQQRG